MLKRYRILLSVFLLIATQVTAQKTRITRTGMPPLNDDAFVAFFMEDDTDFPAATAIEIGILHSSDYVPMARSTIINLLETMKEHARVNGANALKFTSIKSRVYITDPDKIVATMYKIDSATKYERTFSWSKDRKLTWSDFQELTLPDSSTNFVAFAACGFIFEMERVYTTKFVKVLTPNVFSRQISWVRTDSMHTKNALGFQQLKFDMNEVYARQCRQYFSRQGFDEVKLPVAETAKKAYHRFFLDYMDEWEECCSDTNNGQDEEKFLKWRAKIDKQLELLPEFSSH